MSHHSGPITPGAFDWDAVDHVLLDMDGTLLDRHFDNVFFEEELPRRYAAKEGLECTDARDRLFAMYRETEGTLNWTDLPYWSRRLGLNVEEMHREFQHMINFLPDAVAFLEQVRARNKRIHVVTNAHHSGVAIKVARTGMDRYVDSIVNAFHVGYLKMRPEYWPACQRLIGFTPARSLYIDDDEACLAAAQGYGIGHVYHRAKSSSQLPPTPSSQFRSILSFEDLIPTPERGGP